MQIGPLRISSGLWSPIGRTTLNTNGWWPVLLAATSYATWRIIITRLRPASRAHNRTRTRADQLTPGTTIRIHGPINPVGIDEKTTVACLDQTLIRFTSGTQRFLRADTHCHVVHIQD